MTSNVRKRGSTRSRTGSTERGLRDTFLFALIRRKSCRPKNARERILLRQTVTHLLRKLFARTLFIGFVVPFVVSALPFVRIAPLVEAKCALVEALQTYAMRFPRVQIAKIEHQILATIEMSRIDKGEYPCVRKSVSPHLSCPPV